GVRRRRLPAVRPPARVRGTVPVDRLPAGRDPRLRRAEPVLWAVRGGGVQAPGDRLPAPRHADGVPAVRGGGAGAAGPGPERRRGGGGAGAVGRAREGRRGGGVGAAAARPGGPVR